MRAARSHAASTRRIASKIFCSRARESVLPTSARDGEALAPSDVREKVVAFVVDDDERRKIDDIDLPDCLHTELGVLEDLHLLDAVLREPRRRARDRAEVK